MRTKFLDHALSIVVLAYAVGIIALSGRIIARSYIWGWG